MIIARMSFIILNLLELLHVQDKDDCATDLYLDVIVKGDAVRGWCGGNRDECGAHFALAAQNFNRSLNTVFGCANQKCRIALLQKAACAADLCDTLLLGC